MMGLIVSWLMVVSFIFVGVVGIVACIRMSKLTKALKKRKK